MHALADRGGAVAAARLMAVLVGLMIALSPCDGRAEEPSPVELAKIDVVEHLDGKVPLDLPVRRWDGTTGTLRDVVSGRRPIVLTLAYYECPMLCSLVLSGIGKGLRAADVVPGRDVDLVTVSFDPKDDARRAADKRAHYLQSIGLPGDGAAWPFLVAEPASVRPLADALGFVFEPVRGTEQFAHPAVVFVLTPDGRISRYLYGVEFPVRDLRLSLVEAAEGRFGSSFERLLLRCYRYDPASRRYALFVSRYFRGAGVVLLLAVSGLLLSLLRREKRVRGVA